MPHVIVKLWPGRNDEIKSNLAKRIAHTVAEELKVDIRHMFGSVLGMFYRKMKTLLQ